MRWVGGPGRPPRTPPRRAFSLDGQLLRGVCHRQPPFPFSCVASLLILAFAAAAPGPEVALDVDASATVRGGWPDCATVRCLGEAGMAEITESSQTAFLMVSTPDCEPCKALRPAWEQLGSSMPGLAWATDCSEHPAVCAAFPAVSFPLFLIWDGLLLEPYAGPLKLDALFAHLATVAKRTLSGPSDKVTVLPPCPPTPFWPVVRSRHSSLLAGHAAAAQTPSQGAEAAAALLAGLWP